MVKMLECYELRFLCPRILLVWVLFIMIIVLNFSVIVHRFGSGVMFLSMLKTLSVITSLCWLGEHCCSCFCRELGSV